MSTELGWPTTETTYTEARAFLPTGVTIGLGGAAVVAGVTTTPAVLVAVIGVVGAVVALIDYRSSTIPNRALLLSAVLCMASIGGAGIAGVDMFKVGSAVGVGVVSTLMMPVVVHVIAPSAFGFGDIKLLSVLAAGQAVALTMVEAPLRSVTVFGLATVAISSFGGLVVAGIRRQAIVALAPSIVCSWLGVTAYALGSVEGI